MGFFNKVLKSWWVIISVMPLINGLGFVYLGCKARNYNWVIEGIIYEIPWIFAFSTLSRPYNDAMGILAVFIWLFSIIRGFWLAGLFMKSYDC